MHHRPDRPEKCPLCGRALHMLLVTKVPCRTHGAHEVHQTCGGVKGRFCHPCPACACPIGLTKLGEEVPHVCQPPLVEVTTAGAASPRQAACSVPGPAATGRKPSRAGTVPRAKCNRPWNHTGPHRVYDHSAALLAEWPNTSPATTTQEATA